MSETYVVHYSTKHYTGALLETGRFAKRRALAAVLGGHAAGSIDRVDCYDPEEKWARDVTEDFARDLAASVVDIGDLPTTQVRNFLEEQLGVGTAIPAAA
jgi:hypothetical protein